jgi:hypothetical protein
MPALNASLDDEGLDHRHDARVHLELDGDHRRLHEALEQDVRQLTDTVLVLHRVGWCM